jgi:hypothetical protein
MILLEQLLLCAKEDEDGLLVLADSLAQTG